MDSPEHSAEPVNLATRAHKAALRAELVATRTRRSQDRLVAAGAALATWAEALQPPTVVAAYVGVGAEPPTLPLIVALERLGVRVLLPVVLPGGGLDWSDAPVTTTVPTGRLGLREPPGPYLGPAAVREAGLILVPALAVDRAGHRLGRGAGYYDRALGGRSRTARLVAVVFDDELVDEVPVEPHDQPVDGALIPSGLVMFDP
jgi:5-formyltetrahydrofolate cyclo-ligase